MRCRAAPRANFIPCIRTQVVLLFDAGMIAEWVALVLPSRRNCAALLDCIASLSPPAMAWPL